MAKKMLIDATHPEETRVVVADGNRVDEFDFESVNKRQLAGNIYLAKVTRVEPSLQAAFVDYGGNRHGFLAYSEIHPDYYQIPVADREALIEEELAYAKQLAEEEERPKRNTRGRGRGRGRGRAKAEKATSDDAVLSGEVEEASSIPGMDVVDLEEIDPDVASSPMETVGETPVETPAASDELDEADEEDKSAEIAEPVGPAEEEADQAADEASSKTDDEAEAETASEDDDIESVAQEDVTEEIRAPRKTRPKRYKIQEVVKVRQILLVQVVKEERGNKGAALTTYLSLAGRYCVLMPNTARGGGISRKITNAADRKKLKEIATGLDVPKGAGLIVRTAGAKRTKAEIKRDYEYLQRQWEQIRALTLKSIAPAPIYEEGDLVKRSIRDLYNKEIDEVIIEGEAGFKAAKDFMKMIMPSHAKNVKQYQDPMPLFARYQVESYLSGMFSPTVQLKSGGYIVIGVTEALVAIDVNSGRATKEGSIEQTALQTNLEAAEEAARQLRLRDLAGLIVIDFIDMEERRNNNAVEKRLKDKLKTDRARIQVGRISGFGLLEMSRQRLRPGMLEATTQPCPSCHGTGLIRSDDSLALTILRQLEEEGTRKRSREVLLKAPVNVINFLFNTKREHIAGIEERYGMAVRLEADPQKVSPDFEIEKFKTATRLVRASSEAVVSMDSVDLSDIEDEVETEAKAEVSPEVDENGEPKKKRRRRRRGGRGRSRSSREGGADTTEKPAADDSSVAAPSEETAKEGAEAAPSETQAEEAPKKPRRRRTRKDKDEEAAATEAAEQNSEERVEAEAEKPKKTRRSRAKPKTKAEEASEDTAVAAEETKEAEAEPSPKPKRKRASPKKKAAAEKAKDEPAAEKVLEPANGGTETEPTAEDSAKPKKRGWWSLGR